MASKIDPGSWSLQVATSPFINMSTNAIIRPNFNFSIGRGLNENTIPSLQRGYPMYDFHAVPEVSMVIDNHQPNRCRIWYQPSEPSRPELLGVITRITWG